MLIEWCEAARKEPVGETEVQVREYFDQGCE